MVDGSVVAPAAAPVDAADDCAADDDYQHDDGHRDDGLPAKSRKIMLQCNTEINATKSACETYFRYSAMRAASLPFGATSSGVKAQHRDPKYMRINPLMIACNKQFNDITCRR